MIAELLGAAAALAGTWQTGPPLPLPRTEVTGAVVRGDTPHFDYVAGECARGLMDASLATGIPVIFGVLTTETLAQAEERADTKRMNKGRESMEAALEMIQLLAPPPRTPRAPRKARPKLRPGVRRGKR